MRFPARLTLSLLALSISLMGCGTLRSTSTPLDVDRFAPSFTLSDQEGRRVPLRGLLEDGPVVLVFNRGHR